MIRVTSYDVIGRTYALTRRPDPRIAARLVSALGDARSVINVGAGAGSYEPPNTIVAIEPSQIMIDQRPSGSAPALRAVAESIPLPDGYADAALAVLTIHHWSDLAAGVRELRRVARRRAVILTWDEAKMDQFWLMRDYLPEVAAAHGRLAVPLDHLVEKLGGATVEIVPVPHDCIDGFAAAYWRRPEAYLDPVIRAGISAFSEADDIPVMRGLERLERDLSSGAWHARYADLLDRDDYDAGYRLVTAEWPSGHRDASMKAV